MGEWFKDSRTMTEEEILLDYAERLDRHRAGRRAVEIRLSLLRPYHQRTHHLRIARKMFEMLVRKADAAVYLMNNNNLMVLTKDIPVGEVDACVLQLRYLFAEDPLFSGRGNESGASEDDFCVWYDIESQYDRFMARVRQLVAEQQQLPPEVLAVSKQIEAVAQPAGAPMTPDQLSQVERSIAQANLSNILRRQDICSVMPGMKPVKTGHEIYFSMAYLAQTVLPGFNVTSNRWLFQYLTRVLDERMLSLLSQRDYQPMLRNASLNLNLETLLSPGFLEFDRETNKKDRGQVTIELPALEFFSDPADFLFARDFLHKRGYRLAVDSTKHLLLPLMDRHRIGYDMVKVLWTPSLYDDTYGVRGRDLKETISRIGRDRVVLCRVDDELALKAGEELGITLYQGRLIDAALAKPARPAETKR